MRRALPAVAVLALVLAVPASAGAVELVRFDSCRELTRYARERVVQTRGGAGVPFRGDVVRPAVLRPPVSLPPSATAGVAAPGVPVPVATAAPGPPAVADAEAFSSTNVQEAGVDEADLLKTDGRRLYVATGGVLRIFDVTGAAPRPLGRLALEGAEHQLLLRGSRLLVLAAAQSGVLLTEVDLSDPGAPRVARTMELPGRLAGARLTGGTARVVVASSPEPIPVADPVALRALARRQPTSRWLPRTTIRSRITRRTFRRSVVPCSHVRRPQAFSGLDLLSVLTIDLDRGLYSVGRQAVMAGAQDVYASPSSLVVATRRYAPGTPDGTTVSGGVTALHLFDAGAEPRTPYRASGTVPGFVLNQFALSEHEAALRVATTQEAPWTPDAGAQSESMVTVLRPVGDRLVTVGRVGGLGRGERIYGVRFLGDRGYLVTFRQVDPLYVLDLSDPQSPRVRGELKITGYSAYLHPISERLLLGVGQDATEQGMRLGPQVSLFDVGDPARPRVLSRLPLREAAFTGAEQDHHAFLWWRPAQLAVVPVEGPGYVDGRLVTFTGAVALRVADERVTEVSRIAHPAPAEDRLPPPIGRSIVVGQRLLTVSASGIATNALADLRPLSYTPLG
jgi:hypothetical protein